MMNSPHAPAPQACRPADQTQCSTCMLSYDCRSTLGVRHLSWPILMLAVVLGSGIALRLFGLI